ncbi:MAG: F0F1 ATP synthase subunit delta [Pseudomonadales bacterium]|nr:F0F1 ATP synthase subunit delta [Pseudomonadales bacterium]
MAELSTVARPYAKAAFQFANETGNLEKWSDMLNFAALVVQDDAIADLLDNPKVTSSQLVEAFKKIGEDSLDENGNNFVTLLASNKRLSSLPEIHALYETLKAEQLQSVDVKVTSAFTLSDAQLEMLGSVLKKNLKREINIESKVDQSLIGGLVIRAGDMVIDGSVQGKIAKLTETMNS